MRVLLVTGRYPPSPCGIGDYTQKLADSLATIPNVHVGVLTAALPDREHVRSAFVERLDDVDQWALSELPKLFWKICRWRPDIVHFQYPSRGFTKPALPSLLPLLCRLAGMKVVQTWHEAHQINPSHRLKSFLYFLSMRFGASGLIFVRPNYLSLLSRTYQWLIQKIPQVIIKNASPLPLSSLNQTERRALRSKYLGTHQRLIVFFGFVDPGKGTEFIFNIANPATDSVVIAGSLQDSDDIPRLINLAQRHAWRNDQIHFTGFLSPEDAANLLAVADAVVLPFRTGSGEWNTSVHSALAQGTLVITTAVPPRGDEADRNLYTAAPDDTDDMRGALERLAGRRIPPVSTEVQWQNMAGSHINFYQRFFCENTPIENSTSGISTTRSGSHGQNKN